MKDPGQTDEMTNAQVLGSRLRKARDLKKKSLSFVAKRAEMSTAYLQKLEVGDVQQPSPRILHQLSEVLTIDYGELMRLAGYVVPNDGRRSAKQRNQLTHAASSEKLTEEEAEILAEYLSWYRSRNPSAM